jgi:hypothetical protein
VKINALLVFDMSELKIDGKPVVLFQTPCMTDHGWSSNVFYAHALPLIVLFVALIAVLTGSVQDIGKLISVYYRIILRAMREKGSE